MDKFNISLNLDKSLLNKPIKFFNDKNKEEILSYYTNHHTEEVDEGTIHVFDEKINDISMELIVDEKNNVITEYEITDDGTRQVQFIIDDTDTETIFN